MAKIRNVVCQGYRYAAHGQPSQVLRKEEWHAPFDRAGAGAVVRMVAAPVHHQDKWMIRNQWGEQRPPAFPAVAGTDGVGEVEEVGEKCEVLKPGDYVVLNRPDVGTWATNIIAPESALDRVPSDIEPEHLSLMSVYGAAYRMANDYGRISPGDVCYVLGRGALATALASLLGQKGATVFMVFRGLRGGAEQIHQTLRTNIPGCTTIRSELLHQRVMHKLTSDLPPPKFIFNGVGGEALRHSLRWAGDGTKVVSFGNMSREPLAVSVGRHLFQGIELRSFRYARWLAKSSREEREAMYAALCNMMRTGAHESPHGSEFQRRARLFALAERYEFGKDFHSAYNNASQMYTTRKPVLRFGESYEWTHSGEWHKESEYFSTGDRQYLEGINQAIDEYDTNQWVAAEVGGPMMEHDFIEAFQTPGSAEYRKKHNFQLFDMDSQNMRCIEDSVFRHCQAESVMYNFNYHHQYKRQACAYHVPGATKCFYPDDDPYYRWALNGLNSGKTYH